MKEAIERGLKKLEEQGLLTWNSSYVGEKDAWRYIMVEIEKLTFREMNQFLTH